MESRGRLEEIHEISHVILWNSMRGSWKYWPTKFWLWNFMEHFYWRAHENWYFHLGVNRIILFSSGGITSSWKHNNFHAASATETYNGRDWIERSSCHLRISRPRIPPLPPSSLLCHPSAQSCISSRAVEGGGLCKWDSADASCSKKENTRSVFNPCAEICLFLRKIWQLWNEPAVLQLNFRQIYLRDRDSYIVKCPGSDVSCVRSDALPPIPKQ